MPHRLLRPCTGDPTCPELGPGGPCPDHQLDRGTTTERGYGWRWQQARVQVLDEEPTCRACGARTEDVDHIDGDVNNLERSNLQGLCRPCHNRKTARQARTY